jgi:hypothetical protein
MLDELALRRPEFQEGVRVKLCDGQDWTFPRVRLRLIPKLTPDGEVKTDVKRFYAADVEKFLDYEINENDFNFIDWMTKRFAAAAKLLLVNYDITGEQLAELLYWERDDDASEERWQSIDSAVLGILPKASAVGSD